MRTPFSQSPAEMIIEELSTEAGGYRSDYNGPLFPFERAGDFNLEDPIERRKARQIAPINGLADQIPCIFGSGPVDCISVYHWRLLPGDLPTLI